MDYRDFLPIARRLVREAIRSRPNADFPDGRSAYIDGEALSLAYSLAALASPRLEELANP